jgi:hypothetical protein
MNRPVVRVVVATPWDDFELFRRICAVDPRVEVRAEPDLLPRPRFAGDHVGVGGFTRTADQMVRWQTLLEQADILFGIPGETAEGLRGALALPHIQWIHSMWAGGGELAREAGLTAAELNSALLG